MQEEQDAMEADLDKDELLVPQQGELCGDRLLFSVYAGSSSPQHRKKRVSCTTVIVTEVRHCGESLRSWICATVAGDRCHTGRGTDETSDPRTAQSHRPACGARSTTKQVGIY